ncbi:MAG: putative oxidoreductase C-terminal domain-containing protein [Proteiniphilum sp.]|nr:putative oxidoreductase C-terminal domain-containing protein [Proteiniphilum sp.]MDD3907971.1 putative oxidoreductase C-terminal domain-containing protein [Bacteroidales bacterium]
MKTHLHLFASILTTLIILSCNTQNKESKESKHLFTGADGEIELAVLDPGHFHASLLQKFPQKQVNDTVWVYAPEGDELDQYLRSIEGYNQRADNPTDWNEVVYAGNDYLEKMIREKKGNVVVLAGNNGKKTNYIAQLITAGYNVLSDKPMVINKEGFELLKATFDSARVQDIYLYDVMTERYDIINTLTRELVNNKELFGDLQVGTTDEPAVSMQSVHHYFKEVSGNVLVRPAWFYDVDQQGEGLVDVATHLVDLVNWQCFPTELIDFGNDVKITGAKHWPTKLTLEDFTRSTTLEAYPEFLKKYVMNDMLNVYGNGTINYQVKGKNISVTVLWNYQAPEGGGDAYSALIKGTQANVAIVQNEEEHYIKQLYIEKNQTTDGKVFESALKNVITELQKTYPYISTKKISAERYQIVIPVERRKGHEDYFGMVAAKYFQYLVNRDMPEWEISNMLTKYYITTSALELAKTK